jgi:cytochrome c oxidase subunit 1/cytochrome c oxidase subunit I+III
MYYWFPKLTGRMYNELLGKVSFWLTFAGTFVTFFPMHIVGIVGMPRRNYTYPGNLGWTIYNLIESIGAYLLALGLVSIVVNLLISRFRGEPAQDPFHGDTLEWATSSPPPHYNFAVIPTVTTPYGMYDEDDRERDSRRLERGEGVLASGHKTPASTVQDGVLDEILEMPSYSWWPPVSALMLTGMFFMLLLQHFWIAAGFGALGLLALFAWHTKEAPA